MPQDPKPDWNQIAAGIRASSAAPPPSSSGESAIPGFWESLIEGGLRASTNNTIGSQEALGALKSAWAPVEYGGKLLRQIPGVNAASKWVGEAPPSFSSAPTNARQAAGRVVGDVGISLLPGAKGAGLIEEGANLIPKAWETAKVLRGLTRVGGQAALGAGTAYLQGGDPETGAKWGAGGQLVSSALIAAAPQVMEQALRISAPIARKFGRRGELGGTAIEHALMPTQAGADKTGHLAMLEQAQLEDYLRSVGAGEHAVPTTGLANRAADRVRPHQVLDWQAGLNPAPEVREPGIISRFRNRAPADEIIQAIPEGPVVHVAPTDGPHVTSHGPGARGGPPYGEDLLQGDLTQSPYKNVPEPHEPTNMIPGHEADFQWHPNREPPVPGVVEPRVVGDYQRIQFRKLLQQRQYSAADLNNIKGKLDNAADAWHVAARNGTKGAADEAMVAAALSSEIRDELGRRFPEYLGYNERIMNLKGVQYAAQGRADIPAGKLSTIAMVMNPSPATIAGKAVLMPQALGGAAIAADRIGRLIPRLSPALRATILGNLLGGGDEESGPGQVIR